MCVKSKEESFCVHQVLWPCSKFSRLAERIYFWLIYPWNGDVRGAISQQPERARTCYFAGLKALHESFLINQVLCHHSKYSLSDGQNESRLGKHGKIPYTSTSRRTSPWNTPCYLKPLWHNGCQYVRSHHSKGHLYLLSGWRDSPPNRPFYPWTSPTYDVRVTKTAITLLILVRLRWN